MNSYKTKNGVDVWVTRTYDCELNLGVFYCQIYLDKNLEREFDGFVIPAEVVNDNKEEEFILDFISNYWAEVVYEMCYHCENEVVLYAEKKVQKCPECGMWIAPCALCEDCIKPCELVIECNRRNSMDEKPKGLISKELTKKDWDILSNLVLKEMGSLREFGNVRGEAVKKALETEIGKLHTLYNYLID